jgi:hypothetical protein
MARLIGLGFREIWRGELTCRRAPGNLRERHERRAQPAAFIQNQNETKMLLKLRPQSCTAHTDDAARSTCKLLLR